MLLEGEMSDEDEYYTYQEEMTLSPTIRCLVVCRQGEARSTSGYMNLPHMPAGEICPRCKRPKGIGLLQCNFTLQIVE